MLFRLFLVILALLIYIAIIIVVGAGGALVVLTMGNVYAFGILKANASAVFLIAWAKIISDLYLWQIEQSKKKSNGYVD